MPPDCFSNCGNHGPTTAFAQPAGLDQFGLTEGVLRALTGPDHVAAALLGRTGSARS